MHFKQTLFYWYIEPSIIPYIWLYPVEPNLVRKYTAHPLVWHPVGFNSIVFNTEPDCRSDPVYRYQTQIRSILRHHVWLQRTWSDAFGFHQNRRTSKSQNPTIPTLERQISPPSSPAATLAHWYSWWPLALRAITILPPAMACTPVCCSLFACCNLYSGQRGERSADYVSSMF